MSTETFDLAAAARAAYAAKTAAEKAAEEERQRLHEAAVAERRALFAELLASALPAPLQQALQLETRVWHSTPEQRWKSSAIGHYHPAAPALDWQRDIEITLSPYQDGGAVRWKLDFGSSWSSHNRAVATEQVAQVLTEQLGAIEAFLEVRHREARQNQRQADLRRQHEAAEEQGRQAERQAEHARCNATVEALIADATTALWSWPAGAVATFYRVTWCTGAVDDGDGGGVRCDYQSGYSVRDHLDDAGYLTIQPIQTYAWQPPSGVRHLRLLADVHKPVFERLEARAVDDLPGELRHHVAVTIRDIASTGDGTYHACPGHEWESTVGHEPLEWVKALLRVP